jgi:hypothetical protein
VKSLTSTKDLKKAVAIMYYDFDYRKQKEIFDRLEAETIERLKATLQRLNELGKEIKPIYKIATIEDVLKKSTLAS